MATVPYSPSAFPGATRGRGRCMGRSDALLPKKIEGLRLGFPGRRSNRRRALRKARPRRNGTGSKGMEALSSARAMRAVPRGSGSLTPAKFVR
jgi:hypothetical protein